MTTEDKQLLLKDLCARLPYNPYISIKEDNIRTLLTSIEADQDGIIEIWYDGTPYSIEDIEIYLRPMSSMTEGERNEYFDFRNQELQRVAFAEVGRESAIAEISDWLLSHHFDYRGLIAMGLALEAPEGMYKS